MASLTHDQQSAPDSERAHIRDPKSVRTEHPGAVRRVYAEKFARIVECVLLGLVASGDVRASNSAIARAMDVDESRVRRIREQLAWSMGDVLAMAAHTETREAARKVIASLDAHVAESSPLRRVTIQDAPLAIGEKFGALCSEVRGAFADGEVDDDERDSIRVATLNVMSACVETMHALDARPSVAKATPRETSAVKLGIGRAVGGAR